MPTETNPSVKPGYKTSEFWKSLIMSMAGVGLVVYGAVESKADVMDIGLLLAGIPVAGYAVSRGLAKMNGGGNAKA